LVQTLRAILRRPARVAAAAPKSRSIGGAGTSVGGPPDELVDEVEPPVEVEELVEDEPEVEEDVEEDVELEVELEVDEDVLVELELVTLPDEVLVELDVETLPELVETFPEDVLTLPDEVDTLPDEVEVEVETLPELVELDVAPELVLVDPPDEEVEPPDDEVDRAATAATKEAAEEAATETTTKTAADHDRRTAARAADRLLRQGRQHRDCGHGHLRPRLAGRGAGDDTAYPLYRARRGGDLPLGADRRLGHCNLGVLHIFRAAGLRAFRNMDRTAADEGAASCIGSKFHNGRPNRHACSLLSSGAWRQRNRTNRQSPLPLTV